MHNSVNFLADTVQSNKSSTVDYSAHCPLFAAMVFRHIYVISLKSDPGPGPQPDKKIA